MKKMFLLMFILIFLFGCSPSETQINAAIEETNAAKPTEASKSALTVTETQTIKFTPTRTSTPKLRNTKSPTNTPTPKPEPIFLQGSGDDVVEIEKWDGPAIVDIVRDGGGHFAVKSYDEFGESIDLLVNTIGPYEGKVTMDLLGYADTTTSILEISADGPWTISICPFDRDYLNQVDAPGFYENNKDDVLVVDGESATATFKCAIGGNFAVWGIAEDDIDLMVNEEDDIDLMVNEIAPYEGKVMVPKGLFLLIVTAENDWSVEFH